MWLTYHNSAGSRHWLKLSVFFILPCLLLLALLLFMQPAKSLAAVTPAQFSCANVTEITTTECVALVALYTSTDGVNWITNTNWLSTTTPCSWYGVGCAGGQVSNLNLDSNQLRGPLPSELGNLVNLQNLRLENNQLRGAIPPELGNLDNLVRLILFNNQLSGSIPSSLGSLPNLIALALSNNSLTGAIPKELGDLANLRDLRLGGGNQLSGPIPPDLAKLSNLQELFLNGNQLSGPIPPQLGELSNLQYLSLGNNQLSASIPKNLGDLGNLLQLSLFDNQLTGSIPPELGKLTGLTQLDLNNNALRGEIPGELANLTLLQVPNLRLDYNMLSATDATLRAFLATREPDWEAFQTVTPANIEVKNITVTSVDVIWKEIDYQTNTGGYEVGYATHPGGPYTVFGITSSKSVISYTVTGLCPAQPYYFAVRAYTRRHGNQQNDLRSAFSQEIAITTLTGTVPSQLLAIYLLALDSNLSHQQGSILQDLQSTLADATSCNKVALVLADQQGDHNTQIIRIQGAITETIRGLPDATGTLNPALDEYNMADGAQLGTFIKWARAQYSTTQTTLAYIGHGVPLAPTTDVTRYISDTINANPTVHDAANLVNGIFPVPIRTDAHPDQLTDQQSKSLISPYALGEALRIGTDNGTKPLTVLDIVHCFAGTIEEFYEVTPYAQALIGSPNYTYSGAMMLRRALLAIQPGQSPQYMATAMLDAYDQTLAEADRSDDQPDIVDHPRVLVALESSQLPAVKSSVDRLAGVLLQALDGSGAETKRIISATHQISQKYDTTLCTLPGRPQDWQLSQEDGLSDLTDFASHLRDQFALSPTVALTITDVISQVNAAIIKTTKVSGTPWFADNPNLTWTFSNKASGIGIYSDFHGMSLDNGRYLGWQAHWYNKGKADNIEDNPHPYAFLQGTYSWSDVLQRFWQDDTKGVQTIACTVQLPEVQFVYRLYLPVVTQP